MSQEPARRARRVPFTAPVQVRGACGIFKAGAEDISLTGVRIRIDRSVLKMDEAADLATAAATVQTRLGSRFVVELGLRQGAGRMAKKVGLVRLVMAEDDGARLDLGCVFEEPLTSREAQNLNLVLEDVPEEATEVRRDSSWADEGRAELDPGLTEEKVESLFGVPSDVRTKPSERRPAQALRVVVSSTAKDGVTPLVCGAESLTLNTILLRVRVEHAAPWLEGQVDLAEVAQAVAGDYGAWPELEIVAGTRRLWQGTAHVSGIEVGNGPGEDIFLRLAFGRRLQQTEFDRLCDAA